MTLDLAFVLLILVVGLGTAAALVADRNARLNAWRQIALERRWNSEQRHGGPSVERRSRPND